MAEAIGIAASVAGLLQMVGAVGKKAMELYGAETEQEELCQDLRKAVLEAKDVQKMATSQVQGQQAGARRYELTRALEQLKGSLDNAMKELKAYTTAGHVARIWNADKFSATLKRQEKRIRDACDSVRGHVLLQMQGALRDISQQLGHRNLKNEVAGPGSPNELRDKEDKLRKEIMVLKAALQQREVSPLHKFDFDDLRTGTNDFRRPMMVGGRVYKAKVEGTELAVKLIKESKDSSEEIAMMEKVRMHPSVVPLVGYCAVPGKSMEDLWDHEMILVYEFMAGGNLHKRLHELGSGKAPLDLRERICIALDIALGIKFFHHECLPQVVHRDIEPANVLLDDQGRAHISDFGIARFRLTERTKTAAAGALAYSDPAVRGTELPPRPTTVAKHPGVDVYAFGIVLLELLSNREVYSSTGKGEHIRIWATGKLRQEGSAAEFVELWTTSLSDPELEMVRQLGRLALEVTSQPCEQRMSMIEVCERLERIAAPVLSNISTPPLSAKAASVPTNGIQQGEGQGHPVPMQVG